MPIDFNSSVEPYLVHRLDCSGRVRSICINLMHGYRIHKHTFYEIAFTAHGNILQLVNGKFVSTAPGHLTFMRPGTIHQVLRNENINTSSVYFLMFQESSFEPSFWKCLNYLISDDFFQVTMDSDAALATEKDFIALNAMRRSTGEIFATNAVTDLVSSIILRAIKQYYVNTKPTGSTGGNYVETRTYIEQLLGYIIKNFTDKISLKDLADMVHYSPNYLSTMFRNHTGLTFERFLLDLRMHLAAEIIRKSDLNLTDVAHLSGFNSYYWFVHAFTSYFSTSPSNLRKFLSTNPKFNVENRVFEKSINGFYEAVASGTPLF